MKTLAVLVFLSLLIVTYSTNRYKEQNLDTRIRNLLNVLQHRVKNEKEHKSDWERNYRIKSAQSRNNRRNGGDSSALKTEMGGHAHTKDLETKMRTGEHTQKLETKMRTGEHKQKFETKMRTGEHIKDRERMMRTGGDSNEHIKELERGVVNPNSKFMELAESFQVLEDGKKLSPDHIHPENGYKRKADAQDRHPLTHQQKVEMGMESEKKGESRGSSSKRGFTTGSRLWPKAIVPYEINNSSLTHARAVPVIQEAIDRFSNTTCVQFLPHTQTLETVVGHGSYINFYDGGGCWSYVGRVMTNQQALSLGQPGCLWVGIAIHEMLHALGQWHEQSRTDRDNHLTMRWDILGMSKQGGANYGKFDTRDYYPYDYESIMHYGAGTSMEVLQPELKFLTDYGGDLSFYDIADITKAYKCTEHCTNPPECQNGGILNFQCKCMCPEGLAGETCETVETEATCGGIVNLTPGEEVTITSPNYPNSYDPNTNCVWLIKAPHHLRVRVDVDVFHLPVVESNHRCYHWLEVRYNLVGQTGIRKCGSTSGDVWITSPWGEQNLMMLKFDSVYGKEHYAEKGFSLRARTIDIGCIPDPCINGVCKDCDDGTFNCLCDPGYEGKLCDTIEASATLECTFEPSSKKCFLKNIEDDNFEWIVYSGRTPSDLTGPENAHRGDNYIYAEGSSPRQPGDVAILETDIIFPSGDYCLSFYYNMFGADMGSLNVAVNDSVVWTMSGNQGSSWKLANVNISAGANSKFQFKVVRGSNWESDIGLDDVKISPGVCENPKPLDCMATAKGTDYTGTVNTTKDRVECQRWDVNSPHSHSYHDYDNDENYCRNTRGDEPSPWCYTTDPKVRWDFCGVPMCDIEECIRSKNGYEYMGSKSTTEQGKTCAARSDGTRACRGGTNSPKPWCYTVEKDTRRDTCIIPQCTTEPDECIKTLKGADYFGKVNQTKSGRTCQAWNKQTPHKHGLWAMDDQGNFCRNPDGEPEPWCYTTDPDKRFELCDIPYCQDIACRSDPCHHGGTCENVATGGFKCTCQPGYTGQTCDDRVRDEEDCRRSTLGYEYKGTENTTQSNRTCQRWELDTPHGHGFNDLDAENYCRNPDKEPRLWCYTTDNSKRWEFCDVPLCTTPAKECVQSANGMEYFGSVRQTKNGVPCQKWGDQVPHSHSYGYVSEQDDYCRNPYGHSSFPWCYTVDPDIRWDYCDIPRC